MKIIISEMQYKNVFDIDGLVVQEQAGKKEVGKVAYNFLNPKIDITKSNWLKNTNFQPVKPTQLKLNSVPPDLNVSLTEKLLKFGPKGTEIPDPPEFKIDPCVPREMHGYPAPEGWDWCNHYSRSDSYMGNLVTTYYSNDKKIVVSDAIPKIDIRKINSFIKDESMYGWLKEAIKSWNDVNGKWAGMQRDANWSKNIYNISWETIGSLGGNNLMELFKGCNNTTVGKCNTNLLYPGVLIEQYIEFNIDTQLDFFVEIKREIFKKEQAKKVEDYNKLVEKFIEDEKEWNKMYFKEYKKLKDAQNDLNKLVNISPPAYADALRVDLDINLINTETFKSKEAESLEKSMIIGVGNAMNLDLSDLPLKISDKLKKDFIVYLQTYYPDFSTLLNGKPNNVSTIKWLENNNTLQRLWEKFRIYYAYYKLVQIPPPPAPPDEVKARSFSAREGDELSQKEQQLEILKAIIESITQFNQQYIEQYPNSKYYDFNGKGGCEKTRGYQQVRYNEPCESLAHQYYEGTGSDRHMYCKKTVPLSNWKNYCNNNRNGGVWFYKNSDKNGGCGCVSNSTQDYLDQYGHVYTEDNYLQKNVQTDIRSMGEKWEDFKDECLGDWHCIADVASIAALIVLAPLNTVVPGISFAVSAGIDAISAGGYVIEGDAGWQLNAGLTLLGGLFSGADAMKLAKAGSKAGRLTKWSKALVDTVEDMGKLESKLKKMSKVDADNFWVSHLRSNLGDLSVEELKYIDELLESVKNIKGDLKDKFGKILESLKPLTKGQKAELGVLLKNPKYVKNFIKVVENNGWDLAKALEKYQLVRLGKEGLIQASLFGLLTGYSEEIAEKIISGIDTLKELTGINLRPMLGIPDVDKNDVDSSKVEQILDKFPEYRYLAKMIDITLRSSSWRDMKEKYGLKIEKDLHEEIFNSEDPIIDSTALSKILETIDLMYDISKEMESENKSIEEIKNKIQPLLDEALKIAVETTGFRDELNTLEGIVKRTGYDEESIEILQQFFGPDFLKFDDSAEQIQDYLK